MSIVDEWSKKRTEYFFKVLPEMKPHRITNRNRGIKNKTADAKENSGESVQI